MGQDLEHCVGKNYPTSLGGGFITKRFMKEVGFYPVNVKTDTDFLREIDYVRREVMGLDGVEVTKTTQVDYDSLGFPRFHLFMAIDGQEIDLTYSRNVISGQWWLHASSKHQMDQAGLDEFTETIKDQIVLPRIEQLRQEYKARKH